MKIEKTVDLNVPARSNEYFDSAPKLWKILGPISWNARKKIFSQFMAMVKPNAQAKIVGVTVSNQCFITTPNRWFPVEFHTLLPLLHWFPKSIHRKLLNLLGLKFYAKEENLNLLSESEMRKMLPPHWKVTAKHFYLMGLKSNLVFLLERDTRGN